MGEADVTFASALEKFGESTALVLEDGTVVSYRELAFHSDSLFFRPGAPITPRTLIAIECENVLPSVAGYLGALRRGFPALLIDAGLDRPLRDSLYARYGITHLLKANGVWQTKGSTTPDVHPDLALLLSTSGSTGSAKLVRLSLRNLQANAESIADYLVVSCEERPITTLPMHYSYGLSVLNSHLLVGATVLLTAQPITVRGFWDMLRQYAATSIAGVPTTYSMLRQLRFERMPLPSSLRTLTLAGGRLSPENTRWHAELAAARGQRFFVMYGQTEATARIAYVPPERLPDKIEAIGRAIPGGQLELMDTNDTPVTTVGVIGELCYRGPNVMLGYANEVADLLHPDTQKGFLRTGDLAWRDEEGYFFFSGRLQRFIKVFGHRIALDEIEAQLRASGHDVAVTGRDDLLMVALCGAETTAALLAADISTRYRLHHTAVKVVTIDAFPRSTTGKIRYNDILTTAVPDLPGQGQTK